MAWTPDSRIQKLAELKLKRRLEDLATKANEARADAKEHHGFSRHAIAIMHHGVDAEIAEVDDRLVGEVSQAVVAELVELLSSAAGSESIPHEAFEWIRELFTRWRKMVDGLELSRYRAGLARGETELDIKLQQLQLRELRHVPMHTEPLKPKESGGPVDFLLVAALPKELRPAVYKVFKAQRIPKDGEDSRNYWRAVVDTNFRRQYSVRLLAVGRKGGQNTASAVVQAVGKWHPRYVIMFGIAAVCPGSGRKLGDILVADQIADFEETKKSFKELHRPSFWECERALVSHIRELEGLGGKSAHIGWIISQQNLSRKAEYRDQLVKHVITSTNDNNVIGVEMEGGGLAKAIHDLPQPIRPGFMLVKGAVDWGSYHKTDVIQAKMAKKVAIFVREFLISDPVAPTEPALNPSLQEEFGEKD
jgi:nucleoside phosphorylase